MGARSEDGGAGDPLPGAGAVYIFHRTGSNTWDTGVKLISSELEAGDQFGIAVAMEGSHLAVAATIEAGGPGGPVNSAGAVYVYQQLGVNAWGNETKLAASDQQPNDEFGTSVSISGGHIVVGARLEDGGSGDPLRDSGAIYSFTLVGGNVWNADLIIRPTDSIMDSLFGSAVDVDNGTVIVGRPDDQPGNLPGSAYIFR
ncbi:MAG: hypothetical protein KDH09_10485 [Chrysiogenetes bacterium]|nr:hypothetical protein [Chrysiogenetes bacterium]